MPDRTPLPTTSDVPADAQDAGLALATTTVLRVTAAAQHEEQDELAQEVPVALVYNGISHAVMLATPCDLEDFALGFSLSEGILHRANELYGCEPITTGNGIELHLDISSQRLQQLKAQRRSLMGRTGCGLCGSESLAALQRPARQVNPPPIPHAAIVRALHAFPDFQPLRQRSGATHAAAWVDLSGTIVAVREDLGRHNALDKLIGWHARQALAPPGFALISSRASYEMVQKSLQAGWAALIAVSAPTALAVELARDSGLLLAGFARGQQLVVYSQPDAFIPL